MASLNKVFLLGNLGADPEIRFTQGGSAVCNFRMATTEYWNDKNGERQERTEWHRVVVWGKPAERAGDILRKGSPVHIEGRIQTREWEDKDGQRRWTTEIIGDRITFLSSRNGDQSRASATGADEPPPLDDSDIPF